ncbi:MAG: glycosyltransferase family 39 protein [Ignavibacteriae bacterium]|nr:glycosyltransferase family 39 protein [Ignavibacteriota bacterium]
MFADVTNPQLWEFGMIARNLVAGKGYSLSYTESGAVPNAEMVGVITVSSAYMPPGYVWFVAIFLTLVGDQPLSYSLMLIIQSIAGAIATVVLYWVSKKRFPSHVAKFAGYLCAIYPPFVYTVTDFGSTTFYILLLGCTLLAIMSVQKKHSILQSLITGLSAALLTLFRADGLIIAIGLCVLLIIRGYLSYAAVFLIMLIVGLLPWIGRNYIVFKKVVPLTTSFGFNFWRGHNPIASGTGRELSGEGIWRSEQVDQKLRQLSLSTQYEIKRDKVFFEEAVSFIKSHPAKEIMLSMQKLFYLWILDITHPKARSLPYVFSWGIMLMLFFLGLYASVKMNYGIDVFVTYYVVMSFIVIIFFVLPRYQIILAYGITPISAVGLWRLMEYLLQRKRPSL